MNAWFRKNNRPHGSAQTTNGAKKYAVILSEAQRSRRICGCSSPYKTSIASGLATTLPEPTAYYYGKDHIAKHFNHT
jgi:hypothetical protein